MEIKVKSVAFNLDDPDEKKMFEHISQRTNFSAYMKRIIWRDIEGYRPIEKSQENNKEFMEGLL